MIENGADPDETPDLQIDADAYSVWSDMKSTTKAPSTTLGRIEGDKIIYSGASTVSVQDTATIINSSSETSDQEVPELQTGDFDDIQFTREYDSNLPFDVADHDGSDNSCQRKFIYFSKNSL